MPILSGIRNNIQKRESFDQAMDFFRVDAGLRKELWNTIKKGAAATEPDVIKKGSAGHPN